MYFPYLRGRQNELIALRELAQLDLLSDKVLPIIEPVKLSSTLIKTIKTYLEKDKKLSIVGNPLVGNFSSDINNKKNEKLKKEYLEMIKNSKNILQAKILTNKVEELQYSNKICDIAIFNNKDSINIYKNKFLHTDIKYNLIPDETGFRRNIKKNKVLLEDRFKKRLRNTDYEGVDEPFSEDHLYYKDDNYDGFSDFSVVGKEYNETGFAPYAVAIHIVYLDENDKSLRIVHFVSDSNDDITDPAGKFNEAVTKLVEWNEEKKIDTYGINMFKDLYSREAYPGLGVIKKLSIMHHIELIGKYLDQE